MYIEFDGLTSYCVEGAWDLMELSPITYALAKHTPFDYHHIDYAAIADDSLGVSMISTNDIAHNIAKSAPIHHQKYIAKYMYWNLPEWLAALSSRVAHHLLSGVSGGVHRLFADFPVYRNINLLPVLSHEIEALNPVVLDNAMGLFTQGYIWEWVTDSANYLHNHYDKDFDESSVLAFFKSAGMRQTRIMPVAFEDRVRVVGCAAQRCSKKKLRLMRKAVTRARSLFNTLVNGEQIVNAFILGDSVDIEGGVFNYVIRKTYDLLNESRGDFRTIPYKLSVLDKKTGLVLGDLCVYFEDTPILDQVFGLLLYINAGVESEEKLLHKANILSLTDAGRASDLLRSYNASSLLFDAGGQRQDVFPVNDLIGLIRTETPQQKNIEALSSLYLFNRLLDVVGVEYPIEILNAAREKLMSKSTLPASVARIRESGSVLSIGGTYA